MNIFKIAVSKTIPARPALVHAVIADYRVGHQAILPRPYFQELIIEKGGQGAGTELIIHMEVMGDKLSYHQVVEEPEPGHILIERELDKAQFTRFTFEPRQNGQATELTIYTEYELPKGISGWIEGIMARLFLNNLYKKELQNLADYVTSGQAVYQVG